MKRVMIIGGPGSGKSTLARQLGICLSLPVTHLDQLYWSPGWVEKPYDDVLSEVTRIASGPAWVFDGNFAHSRAPRAARMDTLILLDLPTPLRLWRVLRRIVTYLGRTRPDLAEGCPERLDWTFLQWTALYGRKEAPALRTFAASQPPHVAVHHITSRRALTRFLADLPQ